MFRGFKLIKQYYNLAEVKTSLLIIQFLFLLIPALLSILSPILLSNIISALTVYDFSKAIYFLTIDFIIIVTSAIIYFLYHMISRKINQTLYKNFNNYLYENIKKNKNIKAINLPIITNVSVCIDFNKNFLYKLCFLIKSIITLAIIFYYSYIISLVIIFVSFISYLLLRLTDKKIQTSSKHLSEIEQKSLDLFNNIHKGCDVEESYNLNVILKNKYFNFVNDQIKTKNKISLLFSINNNFISLILKSTVFVATFFLIGEIKSTFLTLSLYLILTPYLTSSAQNLISFFELFSQLGYIENILNEFDSLKFKEESLAQTTFDFSGFDLYIYHLNYKSNSTHLKDVNVEFNFGKQYLIYSKCKDSLFALQKLLQKTISPEAGSIFIDSKNLSDIPLEIYKKILSSTSIDPFFYNVSIIENLLMVCSNKKHISNTLSNFGLKEKFAQLKNGTNTIIDENFDQDLLFLLGIVRSYLSGSKIICIQNIPAEISSEYKKLLFKIFKTLKQKCTLICFSNKQIDFSFDKNFIIHRGSLKEINFE